MWKKYCQYTLKQNALKEETKLFFSAVAIERANLNIWSISM
jgi:hypothetical protein